jgi:hypothetical protein
MFIKNTSKKKINKNTVFPSGTTNKNSNGKKCLASVKETEFLFRIA